MKKEYMKPAMRVVELRHRRQFLLASRGVKYVNKVQGNVFEEGVESDAGYEGEIR